MEANSYPTNTGSSNSSNEDTGIAGVNLGFGFCKLVLDGQEDSFMSVLTPLSKGAEGLSSRKVSAINVVEGDDGRQYEVGIDGVFATTGEPMKVQSRSWGRTRHYRLLMEAVLNRLAATGKRRWLIVTGLAADHYRDAAYREDVAQMWKGVNGCHHTRFGVVEVLAVRVLPETAGGFYQLMANKELNALVRTSTGAVLDFGRMTVNWLPFRRDQTDGNRMGSVDTGVSNVLAEATKWLRSDACNPTLHPLEVEAALIGTHPIYKLVNGSGSAQPASRQVSLDISLAKAVMQVWPEIERALVGALGDLRGKLLIGIGGGARIFGDALKEAFPDSTIVLPEDAQMANARGLYGLARLAAARKQEAVS